MSILAIADASYLFAIHNRKRRDPRLTMLPRDIQMIVPQVVLVEVCYLLFERGGGVQVAIAFLDTLLKTQIPVESLNTGDLQRARDIMRQYANVPFDFVDCCIMALSERLNITRILTLDRRDFSIFRPKHCDYLELLPKT